MDTRTSVKTVPNGAGNWAVRFHYRVATLPDTSTSAARRVNVSNFLDQVLLWSHPRNDGVIIEFVIYLMYKAQNIFNGS